MAVLVALLPIPASAQRLELRGSTTLTSALGLSPRLGIHPDSLRRVGRGVYIHDEQVGNGEVADTGVVVSLHFVGLLTDGTIFSSTERKPFEFELGANQVIAGWEDGVLGMRVGGRRHLVIPPFLGYGAAGDGPIPPDAVLVFDVTMVDARRR
jgi:FKBP-type peptidyl-prolyl cis-trans isomerase FkpA